MNWKGFVFCLLLSVSVGAQTSPPASRKITVTFDDLPYVNSAGQPFLSNAQHVTIELMRVLNVHRAPAIGFVNESKLMAADGEIEARIALLKQWLDAGMTLGNHTYSHPDYNRLSIEQFQDDIIKGEVITRRLLNARKLPLRYFRHPMTHAGETQEKKEAVEKFLAARGYVVTPHTIENSDYLFTVPYSRALARNDAATAAKLRAAYLDYTLAVTAFAEQVAPKIFGRAIPHVLLLHANDLNSGCLDEMLKRLTARGYQFVTLDEAMSDAAYQTKDTLVTAGGPTWLWRWNKSLGVQVSFKDDPEPPPWVMTMFEQRQ